MSTPILRCYNLQEEITLQCHASQFGLVAALLQNWPVVYASRALTGAETCYARFEKCLLKTIFACKHFEPYVYSHDLIQVESDHKPLEAIFWTPLHSAPKQLQWMLLRLQKYSLHVTYKRSRCFWPTLWAEHSFERLTPVSSPKELEEVDHRAFVLVSHKHWQQISHAPANDLVLQQLWATIHWG